MVLRDSECKYIDRLTWIDMYDLYLLPDTGERSAIDRKRNTRDKRGEI